MIIKEGVCFLCDKNAEDDVASRYLCVMDTNISVKAHHNCWEDAGGSDELFFHSREDWNEYVGKDYEIPENYCILNSNGTKTWWENGKRHRDNDEPAVVCYDGTKEWYKNGSRHRDNDKPAATFRDGGRLYFKDGKRHRDNDKPAAICPDGTKEYWRDGERYSPRRKL